MNKQDHHLLFLFLLEFTFFYKNYFAFKIYFDFTYVLLLFWLNLLSIKFKNYWASPYYQFNKHSTFYNKKLFNFLTDSPSIGRYWVCFSN